MKIVNFNWEDKLMQSRLNKNLPVFRTPKEELEYIGRRLNELGQGMDTAGKGYAIAHDRSRDTEEVKKLETRRAQLLSQINESH